MSKATILFLGADPEVEASLARAVKNTAVVVRAKGPDHIVAEYRSLGPQVVVVALGSNRDEAFRQIASLADVGARVIVVGPNKDPDLILGALRAGAREFAVASDPDELARVIAAQARPGEAAGGLGRLVTVFPTRGGVGGTTLAVNLAAALAKRGSKTCLVDFDLYLGDVLSFLDLAGAYSITEVIANMSRLDGDLLDTSLIRHGSGVRVLGQSGKVEEAESVRTADVVAMLDLLRRHYDHLIIDGVSGFDEMSLAVLDASQQVVMVLTQDVPAVRSAKRCLDLFRRLGYDDRKIKLVLNRFQRSSKISPLVIEETIGLPIAHTIANDFGSAIESINRGLTLADVAPRSPLTRDIDALAPVLAGENKNDEKRGFLRGLLSRKGSGGTPRAA